MGKGSVASKFLVLTNIIYTLCGMGIIGFSIWFLIQLHNVTNLRNQNLSALDKEFKWIELLPYIYVAIGIVVILISCCGYIGVCKRAVLLTNITFQVLVILALVAAATFTIMNADSEETKDFINKTIWNAMDHTHDNKDVANQVELLEMTFVCCGTTNSTYYKTVRNIRDNLPDSCCNTLDKTNIVKVCRFHDQMARTRPGCVDVLTLRVNYMVKYFAAGAVITAFAGILSLVAGVCLSRSLKGRNESKKLRENLVQHNVARMVADIEKMEKTAVKA